MLPSNFSRIQLFIVPISAKKYRLKLSLPNRVFFLVIALIFLPAKNLFADTVTNVANLDELENALLSGGKIIITGSSNVITLTKTLKIVTNVTLIGETNFPSLNGDGKFRIFEVPTNITL